MKLKIENFQSLRNVDLELAPFTVISGPSDQGKSSLVRALEACLFNTEGKDFISWGEKRTSITLEDGQDSIQYSKGTQTQYVVGGKGYSAIGRGPFQMVADLGYREIDAEHLKIRPQFSKQYDAPFLIADEYSPTAVASILGTLSDSTIVTKAKKALEGDLRELTSKINYVEADVDKIGAIVIDQEATIEELSLIRDKVIETRDNTLKSHAQLDKVVALADRLTILSNEVKDLTEADISSRNAISTLSARTIPALSQAVIQESRITELARQSREIWLQIQELAKVQENIDEFNSFDLSKFESDVKNYAIVENLGVLAANLAKMVKYLHDLIVYIGERLKNLSFFLDPLKIKIQQQELIQKAQNDIHEIKKLEIKKTEINQVIISLEKLKSEFHSCPLCNRAFL